MDLCPSKRVPTWTHTFLSFVLTRTQINWVLAVSRVEKFTKVSFLCRKSQNLGTFRVPGYRSIDQANHGPDDSLLKSTVLDSDYLHC